MEPLNFSIICVSGGIEVVSKNEVDTCEREAPSFELFEWQQTHPRSISQSTLALYFTSTSTLTLWWRRSPLHCRCLTKNATVVEPMQTEPDLE